MTEPPPTKKRKIFQFNPAAAAAAASAAAALVAAQPPAADAAITAGSATAAAAVVAAPAPATDAAITAGSTTAAAADVAIFEGPAAEANEDALCVSVGIRAFMHPEVCGFSGVLKHRYSDFVVNEITPAGVVVTLTDTTTVPPPPLAQQLQQQHEAENTLEALVGEEKARLFREAIAAAPPLARNVNRGKTVLFAFDAIESKETRTRLHQVIKAQFPTVESSTDSGKVVVRQVARGAAPTRREQWSKDAPQYLSFALSKENMDTSYAVQTICRLLHIKPSRIGFAGTKDKRAVTTQLMTVFHLSAKELAHVNNRATNMKVGNFTYVKDCLFLGGLWGNRFRIAIRNVSAGEEVIAAAVASLAKDGFINYFGLQRFGAGDTHTHEIGALLLTNQWEEAVRRIMLNSNAAAGTPAAMAKELFREGKVRECLDALPWFMHIERTLVGGLLQHGPTAYLNAIEMLPRNTRMLYVHAYQSFIWNSAVSERMKQYGTHVVAGDLVLQNGGDTDAAVAADDDEGAAAPDAVAAPEEEDETDDGKLENAAHVVTDEEERSGRYTINDVVMPLPGHRVRYPTHAAGEALYARLMSEHGVSAEQLHSKQRAFCLRGDYRRVTEVPRDIAWHTVHYTADDEPLLVDAAAHTGEAAPKKALLLELSLHKSCYATMCYRELLKRSTSVEAQQAMSTAK
eukprot:TRINITY_DN245_c0_g1_i1.p1 TRINITY_DN245_c0_g1~~TRINITY_DN245_c0_g1_i1.p1  ORF type:complete len:712 (-),score=221.44 TRINITY_DN245_c0_g1_i1:79-2133(-)